MIEINRKYLHAFNQKKLNADQIKLNSKTGIITYTLPNRVELTINLYKQIFKIEPCEYYKLGYQLINEGIYNLIVYLYTIDSIPNIQKNVYPSFRISTDQFCNQLMNKKTKLIVNEPNDLKIPGEIKPFIHQVANVNWMQDVENNCNRLINFNDPYETTMDNQYYFSINKQSMCRSRPTNLGYNFYGGLLADEVGLGKTLCCVLLCYQDKKQNCNWCLINNTNKSISGKCWYALRSGPRRGKRCNKKTNNYYCNSHKNRKNIIDYRSPIRHVPNNLDLINIRHNLYTLKSHANLVLCPGHLCDQWRQEINKYYSSEVVVRTIINKTDFNLLRPRDLMCADYVIVSYSSICSSWYRLCMGDQMPIRDIYTFLNGSYPLLHSFKWNRIFLDEFQDIKEPFHWRMINKLCSNKRWCISGTPFSNWDNLLHTINFVSNRNTRYIESDQILVYFRDNLFQRHTEDQIKIKPNIIEVYRWLDFSDTERSMYDNIRDSGKSLGLGPKQIMLNLQQFCCHPLASGFNSQIIPINVQTIDQIHSTITQFQKEQLNQISKTISEINSNDELTTEQKRQLTLLNKQKNILSTGLDYLQKALSNDQDQLECPICLDVTSKNNQGITKCGHRFCYDPCLIRSYQESTKCPLCNQRLGPDSFYKMIDKINDNDQIDIKLKELVLKFGTKCGQLIYDLKKILQDSPQSGIIIFSQWDRVLRQIDIALKQMSNINTVWCRGTSQSRIKSIQEFNSDSGSRVIMLSSRHTACGTNLTKANIVIFIDPIYESIEERISIETQAIGRSLRIGQTKDVTVIRYLIRDTIEEEAYDKYYKNINLFNNKKLNDFKSNNYKEITTTKLIITDE